MNLPKIKKRYIVIAIAVVLFLLVISPLTLYVWSPSEQLTRWAFKNLPYPAVIIDGKEIITTQNLYSNVESIKSFYEKQDFSEQGLRVDYSTEEGQLRLRIKEKEVLDKLIEDRIVIKEAKERGITITSDQAQKEIVDLAEKSGSVEALKNNLQKLYGWKLADFKERVVLPQMYLNQLVNFYTNKKEPESKERGKIQEAKRALEEKNSDFCNIAKKYSEGDSADNCGDVGWFEKKYLEPNVAEVAYNLEVGEISEIIRSSLGYHVILLEEKREREGDKGIGMEEVKLKQIFVKSGGFVEWLRDKKQSHRVWILLKDYQWDKESAEVKFRDQSMENKEETLRNKSEGDPTFY